MECEHCKLVLKSKYTLKTHLSSNKSCLKLRGLEMNSKFVCKDCNISFISKLNLNVHLETCKKYIIRVVKEDHFNEIKNIKQEYELIINKKDKITNELHEKYKKELKNSKENNDKILLDIQSNNAKEIIDLQTNHSKEIKTLKEFNDKMVKDLQNQLDKMFSTIEKLASQAIDKPNTSNTTSVTTNNVRNNIFSDKYFLENIKPEDVKHKFHNYLTEQVFFSGQKGIAQLCTDHIIKTKDKKVLLTCSDVSRKKFKYVDELGNVKEDYEARTFTEKVFEPIKEVSQQIYQNIISDVQDEQEQLENIEDIQQIYYGRKSVLHDKTMKAIDCFAQIVNIDNPNHNSDFKNELAILNR